MIEKVQIIGREFWDETLVTDDSGREYLFCKFRGGTIRKGSPSNWKFIHCTFEEVTFVDFHPSEFDKRFVQ